jgi:hypothetical protein
LASSSVRSSTGRREAMQAALDRAVTDDGEVVTGSARGDEGPANAHKVRPGRAWRWA